jgi:tetratricopeptide (TPR) repeat protein
MADLLGFGKALLQVVPKIRTLTQLSGLSIALVIFLAAYYANNLPAQIAGGLIGASSLLFTLSLNTLHQLPPKQRVTFILWAFFGFLTTITIFFIVAIYFLVQGPEVRQRAEAELLSEQLRQKYSKVQTDSERLLREKRGLESQVAAASGTFADLAALEARLQTADTSHTVLVQQLDLITALLTDLANPASRLSAVIARAKANLGIAPTESVGLISAARAHGMPAPEVEDLGARILKDAPAEDKQYVVKCLDAAWVYQVRGELDLAEGVFAKLAAIQEAARNPRVIEGRAELAAARGDFRESIRLTDELISVLEQAPSPDLMALALARKDRASRSWATGDLNTAEKFFGLAQDAYFQSRNPRAIVKANIDNELAYYYYLKGNFKRSSDLFDEALTYFKKSQSSNYGKPHTYNNAGLLALKLARLPEAERHLRFSIDLQEKIIGQRTRLHATVLFNLAHLLLKANRFEEARQKFSDAGAILDRWKGAAYNRRLVDVGLAYLAFFGENQQLGLSQFHQAVQALEAVGEPASHWPTLSRVQLSRLYRIRGDMASALAVISAVSQGAAERAPQAWREYVIERGTVQSWLVASGSATVVENSEFQQTLAGDELVAPEDRIRLLLWSTLRALGGSQQSRAVSEFCLAQSMLNRELGQNRQLRDEMAIVGSRFTNQVTCA